MYNYFKSNSLSVHCAHEHHTHFLLLLLLVQLYWYTHNTCNAFRFHCHKLWISMALWWQPSATANNHNAWKYIYMHEIIKLVLVFRWMVEAIYVPHSATAQPCTMKTWRKANSILEPYDWYAMFRFFFIALLK